MPPVPDATRDEATLAAVGCAWTGVNERAHEMLKKAHDAVVRWAWAPWESGWDLPGELVAERLGKPAVTTPVPPPDDPAKRSDLVRYGYAASGAIVVAEVFGDFSGAMGLAPEVGTLRMTRLTMSASSGERVVLCFAHGSGHSRGSVSLQRLIWPVFDSAGDLVEVRNWFQGRAVRRERFDYTGGRVTTIHEDEFAERLGADDEAVSRIRLDIDYDDQGAVERIVWNVEHKRYFPDSVGDRGVTFRRSSPTAVRRARAVRDELPARIAAWARRQDPSEPVCCLALLYNPDAYDVLPSLGLLTDRERRTFVVDTPAPTLNAVLWNPAEWEHFDAAPDVLADDTLQTAAHLLAQEWDAALDDRQPRTTLLRCVRQLQDDDWASILPLAPTFAIYAVDLELCDVDRNLTATVPAATRRALLTGGD